MLGFAENDHPRPTNREIILEDFQPMWTSRTDRQTDRRLAVAIPRSA